MLNTVNDSMGLCAAAWGGDGDEKVQVRKSIVLQYK